MTILYVFGGSKTRFSSASVNSCWGERLQVCRFFKLIPSGKTTEIPGNVEPHFEALSHKSLEEDVPDPIIGWCWCSSELYFRAFFQGRKPKTLMVFKRSGINFLFRGLRCLFKEFPTGIGMFDWEMGSWMIFETWNLASLYASPAHQGIACAKLGEVKHYYDYHNL